MHIERSDETVSTRYFHKDHLGSISVIPDENGAVSGRESEHAALNSKGRNTLARPGDLIAHNAVRTRTHAHNVNKNLQRWITASVVPKHTGRADLWLVLLRLPKIINHAVPVTHRFDVLLARQNNFVGRVSWTAAQNDGLGVKDFLSRMGVDAASTDVLRTEH